MAPKNKTDGSTSVEMRGVRLAALGAWPCRQFALDPLQ
jgi:hypothetical protein